MGTHTKPKQRTTQTSIWLQTRHLLKETTKQVQIQSVTEIIKTVFDEDTDIINWIVEHSTAKQIQKVQTIINRNNKDFKDKIDESKQSMDIDSQKVEIRRLSDVSQDLIGFICGFLNRQDIQSFKSISSKISIACLKEMNKYQVWIFILYISIGPKSHIYFSFTLNGKYTT